MTLWHFTLPLWFSKKGGFQNPKSPEIFARYCAYVVSKLGNEAKFWMTINEPIVWASESYLHGRWPPFTKNYISYVRVIVSLIKSHKLAYKKIKELNSDTQVGVAKNNQYFDSDKNPINILIRIFIVWFRNKMFLNAISEHQDFIGLNHYFYRKFGGNSELSKSDMGWAIYPPAIYFVLKELVKYKKPVYITENGIADAKDLKRADFIRDYIDYVKKSIDEGVNVRGYFYWSLLDNYEWSFGFDKRFGLVEVDYGTMERKIRPSAYVYKGIIENGL